jgi:hypothetical protein
MIVGAPFAGRLTDIRCDLINNQIMTVSDQLQHKNEVDPLFDTRLLRQHWTITDRRKKVGNSKEFGNDTDVSRPNNITATTRSNFHRTERVQALHRLNSVLSTRLIL